MMRGRIVTILKTLKRTFSRKRKSMTFSNPLQKRKPRTATREAGTNGTPAPLIGKMNNIRIKDVRLSLSNLHTTVKMMKMITMAHHLPTWRGTMSMILKSQIRTTDISLPPIRWADACTALVGEIQ